MTVSDIYITAFLTCLAIHIIFYVENYRLRKLKYHFFLITTFTFCGSEIEIEQTTRKPHQICTNNISNRETLTLFLQNKRFFKSWRISFSQPFRKAKLGKNSTLFEFWWQVSSCLSLRCSTSAPGNVRFTRNSCCRFMLSFPIHFSRKLLTFDTIACNLKFLLQQTQM